MFFLNHLLEEKANPKMTVLLYVVLFQSVNLKNCDLQ